MTTGPALDCAPAVHSWSSRVLEAGAAFTSRRASFLVLVWVALAGVLNVAVPQLEVVEHDHSKPFFADGSPAVEAAVRMGHEFNDATTNNLAYVVFESSTDLTAGDYECYARIVARLRADSAHVESVLDLWPNPSARGLTASDDGRAVVLLVRLSGQIGDAAATKSVAAVRDTLRSEPPPPNLRVFLSGPGASVVDEFSALEQRLLIVTGLTVVVIALLLLCIYRSIATCAVVLCTVGLSLATARGFVAWLGQVGAVEVSTFSVSLMAAMVLGAGTDYAIFIVGRYHESRRARQSRTDALAAAYVGVLPVVVASGLTVAIAMCCLAFSSLGLLRSAGYPCALAILVTVAVSVTLTPALLVLAGRFGWCDPRPGGAARRWRRLGTMVVRWPKPLLTVAVAVLLLCALPLASFSVDFDERAAQPRTTESNLGYQASDRHFPANMLLPQYVWIHTDHDMRTPAGLSAIDDVTRHVFAIPGVRSVQSATRPTGTAPDARPRANPFAEVGQQMTSVAVSVRAAQEEMAAAQDLLSGLSRSIQRLQTALDGTAGRLDQVRTEERDTRLNVAELRGLSERISTQLTSLRDYVAATPGCPENSTCSLMSQVVEPVDAAVSSAQRLDALTSRSTDGSAEATRSLASAAAVLTGTQAQLDQTRQLVETSTSELDSAEPALSRLAERLTRTTETFERAPDGSTPFPAAMFDDPLVKAAGAYLFSADGHTTRMVVYGEGAAWSDVAARQTGAIRDAIHEATKQGSLSGNVVGVTGVGAYTEDLADVLVDELRWVVIVALGLILVVVCCLIRSPVAALTVVATVGFSYLAALGVTVALWTGLGQHGIHWAVLPLSFIALVAVGTDYNLLFAARLKGEVSSGFQTGLIRTFAGTGGIVTVAGIVFAVTMLALLAGGVTSIAQIGTAVGVGLLIDTLIVRAIVLPASARLLGRWFWWPRYQPSVLPPRTPQPVGRQRTTDDPDVEEALPPRCRPEVGPG